MELQDTEPANSTELLEACLATLRAHLPADWAVRETQATLPGYDAALTLSAPNGTTAHLAVASKKTMQRRDVAQTLDQFDTLKPEHDATPLVMSRYLSPSVREALVNRAASYIDATGNLRLQIKSPLVYIADRGQDRDPWRSRQGRPRGTLKGTPASRIIRTLIDFNREWSVRELVEESKVSTGATYRVLQYLQEEDLAHKTDDSRYKVKSWRALLESWSKDYGFQKSNRTMTFIDPRGIANLSTVLRGTDSFEWAVTGSVAASEWAPYAPARAAYVYVENISIAAVRWQLRAATTGANVILAEPESDIVFKGTTSSVEGTLRIAAPSQVAVDLLTSPGRNPSEGVELLNWMERNETLWRR